MAIVRRQTSQGELEDVVAYWKDCPRCSGHYEAGSLIQFLEIFTPHQIKGAMFVATSSGRPNYFTDQTTSSTFVGSCTTGAVISKQVANPGTLKSTSRESPAYR